MRTVQPADDQRGASPRGVGRRIRALPGLMAHAPGSVAAAVGVVLVCAGVFLLGRPLTALGVLGWYVGISCVVSGLSDLLLFHTSGRGSVPRRSRPGLDVAVVAACAWVAVGVVILAWVGRRVDLLGPLVAGMLLVSGASSLLRLVWHRSGERWLAAVFGVAEVAFGLVALLWPDATLIVVAVLFGGRTAVFGLSLVWRGLITGVWRRPPRSGDATDAGATGPGRGARWRTGARWLAAVLALVLAGGTVVISRSARDGIPMADRFYDAPAQVPDVPGRLLRWEPYHGDLPEGMTGYRLLYVTTNGAGATVLASAALAVPVRATHPAPLISWAHGTVGVARGCAPTIGREAITTEGMPAMDALARDGWAMVATDYPGMGTEGNFPYLIGEGEGRAVLDAARAARQVPNVTLGEQTAIWGHSQGGHGALWAGQLAGAYAPDLHVVGTAALSPASDPEAMAATVLAHPEALGASLGISFVVDAYTRYYAGLDLDQVVVPSARTIVREAAARCTSETGTLVTVLTGLAIAKDQPIVRAGALEGPFGDRLRENIPTGPWTAPLLIAQGEADEVIPFSINQHYVAELCRDNVPVEFEGYPGGTHMSVLDTGSVLSRRLEAWTRARLAGAPAGDACG